MAIRVMIGSWRRCGRDYFLDILGKEDLSVLKQDVHFALRSLRRQVD